MLNGQFCRARTFPTKRYCRFQMMAETRRLRSSAVANAHALDMLRRRKHGS
jgi:hypothetical protein